MVPASLLVQLASEVDTTTSRASQLAQSALLVAMPTVLVPSAVIRAVAAPSPIPAVRRHVPLVRLASLCWAVSRSNAFAALRAPISPRSANPHASNVLQASSKVLLATLIAPLVLLVGTLARQVPHALCALRAVLPLFPAWHSASIVSLVKPAPLLEARSVAFAAPEPTHQRREAVPVLDALRASTPWELAGLAVTVPQAAIPCRLLAPACPVGRAPLSLATALRIASLAEPAVSPRCLVRRLASIAALAPTLTLAAARCAMRVLEALTAPMQPLANKDQ